MWSFWSSLLHVMTAWPIELWHQCELYLTDFCSFPLCFHSCRWTRCKRLWSTTPLEFLWSRPSDQSSPATSARSASTQRQINKWQHTHNITASHLVFIFFMALKIFYFSLSKNQPFISKSFEGLFVLVCSPGSWNWQSGCGAFVWVMFWPLRPDWNLICFKAA